MYSHGSRGISFQQKNVKKNRRKSLSQPRHTGLWRQISQKLGFLLQATIPIKYLQDNVDRKRLQHFYLKLKKLRPADILETLAEAVHQGKEVFVRTLNDLMSRKIEIKT